MMIVHLGLANMRKIEVCLSVPVQYEVK